MVTWPIGDDNEMFIAFSMVQCIPFGFIGKSSKTFKLFCIDFVVQFNGHSIQIGYLTYRSSFSVDAGFRRIVCWLSISTTHCVLSSISVIFFLNKKKEAYYFLVKTNFRLVSDWRLTQ